MTDRGGGPTSYHFLASHVTVLSRFQYVLGLSTAQASVTGLHSSAGTWGLTYRTRIAPQRRPSSEYSAKFSSYGANSRPKSAEWSNRIGRCKSAASENATNAFPTSGGPVCNIKYCPGHWGSISTLLTLEVADNTMPEASPAPHVQGLSSFGEVSLEVLREGLPNLFIKADSTQRITVGPCIRWTLKAKDGECRPLQGV